MMVMMNHSGPRKATLCPSSISHHKSPSMVQLGGIGRVLGNATSNSQEGIGFDEKDHILFSAQNGGDAESDHHLMAEGKNEEEQG